jgi:hypothetical protein
MQDCCGGYGEHLMACERKLAQGTERAAKDVRLPGKVNVVLGSEPLLPHSVEVQHNWTDAELYPHSSFTFKPAQPLPVKPGAKRKEKSKEAESESEEDDEYSSSEDEGEVFIRGALNKKKRGAPKEYLPKHREPVLNPLSVEERVKRKETRVLNREASRQRNLAMIKAIMGEVMEKLATHRHIKHFRTDLHKCIDLGFNHVKDVPETMNAARLEIVQDKQLVPVLPDSAARAPKSARRTFVSGANRVPLNSSQPAGVTNINLNAVPKFDKTNYQTEIMIEIEHKPFRIIADSGATSSGINLLVVKELNLLSNMKPTEYTYRTSSGKVEKALGTVEVSLRIGPIVVKTDMVVMPSGCGYNMLLGNELMTTLRADIMRSLKVVRFQVGDCITSVPMLPRETRAAGNPVEVYFKVDCREPWINNKPPTIHVDTKNVQGTVSSGTLIAQKRVTVPF